MNKQVYFIDDSKDQCFLVKGIFSNYLPGYKVDFFEDGAMLKQKIDQGEEMQPPGLVIVDYNMRCMDGAETSGYIRSLSAYPEWRHVPIVIFSGLFKQSHVRACYAAGANSFLLKPIGFEQTRQTLEKLCYYWLEMNVSAAG